MRCNLCGSRKNKIIWTKTRFENNNIRECQNCGLVFLESKRSGHEIEEFYEKKYRKIRDLPIKSAAEMFKDPVMVHDAMRRIEGIKQRVSLKGKEVLEIGSACGRFLVELKKAGAKKVEGIELTDEFARFSEKKGFTIHRSPIENLRFSGDFDFIFTFHTLEHMVDPRAAITASYKALKKGGYFIGCVPNQDDWRLKIFDSPVVKYFHYDPNHTFYFSPKTLGRYFKGVGFSKQTIITAERYNSLVQLQRILSGEYDKATPAVLRRDIFAKPKRDVRLPSSYTPEEKTFNAIFEPAIDSVQMGNSLCWIVQK